MLVISGKVGQTVLIGENVEVTILDVQRGVVKIGVTAPKSTLILRSELRK